MGEGHKNSSFSKKTYNEDDITPKGGKPGHMQKGSQSDRLTILGNQTSPRVNDLEKYSVNPSEINPGFPETPVS